MLPIRDVAELRRGVRVVKEQLSDEGAYPVYQNSMTPLGYFEKGNCLPDTTFVIAAGAAGEVGYSRTAFWAADDCYYFECTDLILSRFLYHLLQKKNALIASKVRKASIPRLPRIALENMMIAIPSVGEQQRIVSILDRFDILCNDLISGLPAEIEARQKQYEYYRDKLLAFSPADGSRERRFP